MDNYFECNFSRVLFFEPLITWIFEDKSNQEMTNLLNFPKPKALVITSNDYNSNQMHQHLVLVYKNKFINFSKDHFYEPV